MGHIRLGRLPKTRKWRAVFSALESAAPNAPDLAAATAEAAEERFAALAGDPIINFCFWTLVRIATSARSGDFTDELLRLGFRVTSFTSGLSFVHQLSQAVERQSRLRGEPNVFSRMAQLGLREVVSANILEQSRSLFGTETVGIQAAWRALSTEARFGRVARQFFADLMSRSLRYLVDKELSNHVGPEGSFASPSVVLEFHKSLDGYCFESAKIVEEFASGWFSKHNWQSNNNITEANTAGFTAYAIEKIAMELQEGRR
ncbi:MAG: hypothetical protein HY320_03735 [Armatimonadetes bacterium]|nr:hypothetical protein [Armatimonadota bacterium]